MELLWSFFWIFLILIIYIFLLWRIKVKERFIDYYRLPLQVILCSQRDQNSIYNISSRVEGRNQTQYPDSYLSVDQVHITNELNNKPPKYDDAPPTYEEATKLAIAQSNSIQTYEMEQAQSSNFQQQQEISNSRSTSSVTNQTQ